MFGDYIKPSDSTDEIDQSDIFKEINFSAEETKLHGILVTPICDIVHPEKVDYLNFCAVLPFDNLFFKTIESFKKPITREEFIAGCGKEKKDSCSDFVHNVLDGKNTRYQFLGNIPNTNNDDFWYVDFQLTQSVKTGLSNLKPLRVAKLISPLRESVFVRFSNHMGRVGLPGEEEEKRRFTDEILEYMKMEKVVTQPPV